MDLDGETSRRFLGITMGISESPVGFEGANNKNARRICEEAKEFHVLALGKLISIE